MEPVTPGLRKAPTTAEFTVTLVYNDVPPVQKPGARRTLQVANQYLRMLRESERSLTGKPPRVVWKVNIYSLEDRAVIEFGARELDGMGRLVGERALELVRHVLGTEGSE